MPGSQDGDDEMKTLATIMEKLTKLDLFDTIEGPLCDVNQLQHAHYLAINRLEQGQDIVPLGHDANFQHHHRDGQPLADDSHEERPPRFHKPDFPKYDR